MSASTLPKTVVMALLVSLWGAGCRSHVPPPRVEFTLQKVMFQVGDTKVQADVTQIGTRRLTLINLHEDEQTSVRAGQMIIENHGGRFIRLVHSGQRRVLFSMDGASYSFDPNRVFSKAGVRNTVRGDGAVPERAYLAVEEFARQFVSYFQLKQQKALIALHNNGDGSYSIRSYAVGAVYEADTLRLHINPAADPDDFYYVTEERYFDALRERKLNVVLQDNRILRDDGSLSVFAGRHQIPYLNVEAQNDHLEQQVAMIELALELVEDRGANRIRR